ncbi:MAG: hypothetical protein AAFP78_03830, partial [Pseudomonadota bacterium]
MAVVYYPVPRENNESLIRTGVESSIANAIDEAINGGLRNINIEVKAFVPGVTSTLVSAINVAREGDTFLVSTASFSTEVVLSTAGSAIGGALLTAAVGTAVLATLPAGVAALAIGVAGAAATIALDFLIGDTVENFFEAITGTLDNSLFLEIGGQRVAEIG